MPTAIVSGALANKPLNGGNAWTRLSWVRGLERLGYDVYFVEQVNRGGLDGEKVGYFRQVTERFGLSGRAGLICNPDGREVEGTSLEDLAAVAKSADLLLNISGHLTVEALKFGPRVRVYYDDDPGFTQFWHASGSGAARLDGHDFYFTIGQNVGSADCPIPTGGIHWRHTLPPVVLDDWPVVDEAPQASSTSVRFTTVASWRGPYGPVQFGGRTYGLKAHQFRRFIDLPRLSPHAFEIALDIHPNDAKDLESLRDNGWCLVDPKSVAAAPDDFATYVRESDAEFSVAQGMYVDTSSGWFSDRTTRYLASGRPVLVQDTGFAAHIACGAGLVPFWSIDEAVRGAQEIARNYAEHCHAARAVAEKHFDSDKVIARLLDEIGLPHGEPG